MDFSLRVNRKQIATNSSPYRDQQFQHICSLRTRFQRQGLPIISVDTKKREMIGNFKNAGAKWDRSPVLVNDHDFLTDASGVGISYGIYDPPNNRGTVCVGISHDTPAFAAHSIATWWKREGTRRYGRAPSLLLLADSGGSNSCTSWAWKIELQRQLCNRFGLAVTIAHYPTGASKWNPIERKRVTNPGDQVRAADQRLGVSWVDFGELAAIHAGQHIQHIVLHRHIRR